MTQSAPKTDRVRVHFRQPQHVRAEPETIFPLLCPVREFDWIPTWDCDLVYTESGFAEEGCVFRTDAGDGGLDTWVVSRYEPPKRISFVRVNRLRVIRYDIYLEPEGDGSTALIWEQEITALDDEGDRHVAAQSQEEFAATIGKVERMLEHYLETGEAMEIEYAGT
jgi:hypothetical protein